MPRAPAAWQVPAGEAGYYGSAACVAPSAARRSVVCSQGAVCVTLKALAARVSQSVRGIEGAAAACCLPASLCRAACCLPTPSENRI